MFGFLRVRRPRARRGYRCQARLMVVSLETRVLCSAGGLFSGSHAGFDDGQYAAAAGTMEVTAQTSAGPTISDFQAIEEVPGIWTFRGRVTGYDMVGRNVTLGGLPSLNGKVVRVEESGWFYCTVRLQAGEHGRASARTSDWFGHQSNVAVTHVPRR